MLTNNHLNKKFDEALATIEPQQQQLSNEQLSTFIFDGDVSLFQPDEWTRIQQLVASITPRVAFKEHPTYDFLTSCTEAEFALLCHYQDLLKALMRGDQEAITKHREALANA